MSPKVHNFLQSRVKFLKLWYSITASTFFKHSMTPPLSFSEQLLIDTKNDNLYAVKKLIANNLTVVDTSMHALYYATANNKPEFVAELLKVTDATAYENTVLNLAVEMGHNECVELLFECSNFNLYNVALRCAVNHDRAEILQWMLERAPFSTRTIAEGMAQVSVNNPNEEVFKVLYLHGGRDAFEQFFDIKRAQLYTTDPDHFLQLEYWANEVDGLKITQSLECDGHSNKPRKM